MAYGTDIVAERVKIALLLTPRGWFAKPGAIVYLSPNQAGENRWSNLMPFRACNSFSKH
jgi:hypothetical protein